ncbi:hypothetical protein [Pseudomonas sp. RGB]|uniref:hypothetical protein n=1 Tax=Pseudomonas sp. RGB TaxID=2598474 RepID=UPI00118F5059|nr:hypothetical protein [Pseudomonas sp. RGB]TVT87911.1 hypothetical protein FPT15_27070 [Pseudomonas sp. RGB]
MKFYCRIFFSLTIMSTPLLADELSLSVNSPPGAQSAESNPLPTAIQLTESKPLSTQFQNAESQQSSASPQPLEAPSSTEEFEAKEISIQPQHILVDKLDSISRSNDEIVKRIETLKQTTLEKLYPAIFGFLGILIGGGINFFLHRSQLSHNLKERKEKFSFEVKQKIFEYRNKQNNDFYGPLLVLLAQSKELSSQLHDQLQKFDCSRYKYRTNLMEPRPKKALHIFTEGTATPFRLIEDLPYLGKHIRASLPQVLVIIEVGEQLSALIERSSGLANPKNLELSGCLGTYLAHLRALKDAYAQAKKPRQSEPTRLYTAVFPRQIYDLAKKDYDEINTQIEVWENQAKPIERG